MARFPRLAVLLAASLVLSGAASVATATTTKKVPHKHGVLTVGDTGHAVKNVEKHLHELGYKTGKVDGTYTVATEKAVKKFQRKHHIRATGEVNAYTGKKLAKAAAHAELVRKVLHEARKHLGFHEGRGNANPFSHYFGRPGEAWCADFVSYCFTKSGYKLDYAGTDAMMTHMKSIHKFHKGHPEAGDIIWFDWVLGDRDPSMHVGIVESVKGGMVHTIEGNASDSVKRNSYSLHSRYIVGYATVK